MRPFVLTLALVAASGAAARADEEKTYDFGGLRKVKVTLTTEEADYRLEVRMLAVRCFDAATNREVNQGMAREYALQALARHLARKPAVTFAISGAREVKAGADGKFYTLTLRVPRAGVTLVAAGDAPQSDARPKAGARRATWNDTLFQRKGQYLQTIHEWGAASAAELQEIARKYEDDPDALAGAVAAFTNKVQANAGGLAEEIRADGHLFSVGSDLDPADRSEKDQLLDAVGRERDRLLKQAAAVRPRPSPEKDKKP